MKIEEAKKRIEKLKIEVNKYRYEFEVLDQENISPEAGSAGGGCLTGKSTRR